MAHPQTTDAEDMMPQNTQNTDPATPPQTHDDDARSDIEQAVAARSDAVERGEGGSKSGMMTDPGEYSGNAGTGGEVKNQDITQQ